MEIFDLIKEKIPKEQYDALCYHINKQLVMAYNLGWDYCLKGDDSPSLDLLSAEDILTIIRDKSTSENNLKRQEDHALCPPISIPVWLHEKYQQAIRFAGEKHQDQKIPSSEASYMVHVSNVAMEVLLAYFEDACFDVEFAVQVALLHDVLEDTDCGFDELQELFGMRIAKAVHALSKDKRIAKKSARMNDSLDRVGILEIEVGMVKLADRITNLQQPPKHWKPEKIEKYQAEAQIIYEKLKDCNLFLAKRLRLKIEDYYKYL